MTARALRLIKQLIWWPFRTVNQSRLSKPPRIITLGRDQKLTIHALTPTNLDLYGNVTVTVWQDGKLVQKSVMSIPGSLGKLRRSKDTLKPNQLDLDLPS